jgi:serine/threonine-protein kinase
VTIPATIGKYEILEQIGAGGFGAVYKARDPFIKRLVAVKLCTADDEQLRKRFFREAEISGNLHHPNIVTVFDSGMENGAPYLIQEYLGGEDLDRVIRRGDDIPLDERIECLISVAKGLQYAHGKGVLHRDVKPGNVRFMSGGNAKLMDFGIATLKSAHTRLTRIGTLVGTVGYLAPEQLRGSKADERVDIFSFGRCLDKDPSRRYPSFGEVLPVLEASLEAVRPARRPSELVRHRRRGSRLVWWLGIGMAALVLALLLLRFASTGGVF